MDVLVKWKDGSVNCVATTELKIINNNGIFEVGTDVKMLFKKKWYYGTITEIENNLSETSSS